MHSYRCRSCCASSFAPARSQAPSPSRVDPFLFFGPCCVVYALVSLTCRTFDIALAEVCHMEGVSLLAYSPLAMGLLTVRAAPTVVRVFGGVHTLAMELCAVHLN